MDSLSESYYHDHTLETYNLIFRLFLMGKKEVICPNSYRTLIYHPYMNAKSQYNRFIDRLWSWAKEEKGENPDPSSELKGFCCYVLRFLCNNNSGSTVKPDYFGHNIKGWNYFYKKAENVRYTYEKLAKEFFIKIGAIKE